MSTRPSFRATMSRSAYLARTTVEVTLRSMISSSSARSFSTNAPPLPTPALSAAAASGRPVACTAPQVGAARGRRAAGGLPAPPGGGAARPGARVALPRLHRAARLAQLPGRAGQLGVLGGDHQVEAVLGELAGELEADAAGGAGD